MSTNPKKRKLSSESSDSISDLFEKNSPKKSKIQNTSDLENDGLIISSDNLQNSAIDLSNTNQKGSNTDPNNNFINLDFQPINSQQGSNIDPNNVINLDSQQSNLQETENNITTKLDELLSIIDHIKTNLDELNSSNLSNKEYELKNYLQPNNKKDLFSVDELITKEKISNNFVELIQDTMNISKINVLFDSEEIDKLNDFINLDDQLRELYLLLFFKKNKWSNIESINLTTKKFSKSQLLKQLEELEDGDYLLGSNGIENLEQGMYLLENKQISEVCNKCFTIEKSKTKNISAILRFVKKNKTALSGETLEESKLKKIKRLLKGQVFKVNPSFCKILFKILVTQFEPITFDKDIYHYFFNLISNLNDLQFADKFPILKNEDNQIIYNNQTYQLYDSPADLNNFLTSCLIEFDLYERNYSDLKDFLLIILSKLEDYLGSNYIKDSKIDKWLIKFTANGRLLEILKQSINLLDNNLDELIGQQLKNLIVLFDCDDEEENEEIFNLEDIEIEINSLNISQQLTINLKKNNKKKPEKIIEEDLILEVLKDQLKMDNGFKNQSNLFEIYLFDLFYEIIYDLNIDNTFLYKYQKFPLDINYKLLFYKNRKEKFNDRIDQFNNNKSNFLIDKLKKNKKDFKCLKFIIKSNQISLDKLTELLLFIPKDKLMNIILYLVKDFKQRKNKSSNLILYDRDNLNDPNRPAIYFIETISESENSEIDKEKLNFIKLLKKLDFCSAVYSIEK